MHKSIWADTVSLPSFPPLAGDYNADVLIIGGGMAGLLCAYQLKQAGVGCLVIDAGRIGGGVTAGTTAKITSQHGFIYHKLLEKNGGEIARVYWEANHRALEEYARLAGSILCDYEVKNNYVYSTQDPSICEAELEACCRAGIPAELAVNLPLPISAAGAVCFRDQAQFHPLKFLSGIAEGLDIREHTRAVKIEKGKVWMDSGVIRADQVIVATHFPILNRRGLYFLKQYQDRSYALALEGAQDVKGMYLDGSGKGLSFRNYGSTLILGGSSHRTGKPSSGWETLSVFARAHYPGSREVARWAAQDCMTLDGIPYIGQYSPGTSWLHVATGFNKWGMTGSMVSAMLLRDRILNRENPWAYVFDPSRSMLHSQLGINAWESVVNLLTLNHPRCPHMGCALKWNPLEHAWDCPCHGSRFDHRGKLLDTPAVKNMKKGRH